MAVAGAAALLFLLLPILFIPLAKRRRAAARRSQRDPELAALSAWQEMTDRARDAGVVLPVGVGRRQLAEVLDPAPARWAAGEVDRAVFSPESIGATETQWLWAAVDADRAEREAGFGFWRRMRTVFALRSYGVQRARLGADRRDPTSSSDDRAGAKEKR